MHRAPDLLTRWPALDAPAKRARIQDSFRVVPGRLADAIAAHTASAERAAGGLWMRDASAWSADAAVQKTIANRLGWLSSPPLMADALPRLHDFAASVQRDGFTDIVLLGMGGSSLAPEVLRAVVGVAAGWPRFHMLDSTDPDAVRAVATEPQRTLYILASKSGTTIEPNSLAAHFRGLLESRGVRGWASHFVAITDDATALHERARAERFREVFVNPGDIGGRYSAISYFGLVPAALMGQNITSMVGWAVAMLAAAQPGFGTTISNPALGLGLVMGAAANTGYDKLTLVVQPALEPFGLWVEQLVAESTGKNGKGIVPIAGETLAGPAAYGSDRLFVRMRSPGAADDKSEASLRDLLKADVPIAGIELAEPAALGAEFVRWEVATAVAGAVIGVNPFDEPNVTQAKDATRTLLDVHKSTGSLPAGAPDATIDSQVALTLSTAARAGVARPGADAFLRLVRPGDYLAILAYVPPDPALYDVFRTARMAMRNRLRVATMFGYGPRYLHSTGQLHKGGPNTGVFILVTAAPRADLPIPGEAFSFATLEKAQALGDFASLDATGRRALHVHLPASDPALLRRTFDALLDDLPRPR